MPRPLRLEFENAWYHVMNYSKDTKPIFVKPEDYANFLSTLKETVEMLGIECHAYCLLPKEFHLIIHTPKANLSNAMRHLNSVYTQRFNLKHKQTGSRLKGRFKSVLFEAQHYLSPISQYIHMLPLKYRSCKHPLEYPYSSYKAYLDPKERPTWLKTQSLLKLFPAPHDTHYQAYVENAPIPDLNNFYKKKKLNPYLGTSKFLQHARQVGKEEHVIEKPSMETLIKSTASIFREAEEDILKSKRGRGQESMGRTVAMYLCRYVGQYPIKDIAKTFNVSHESTISVRLARFKPKIEQDPSLKSKLNLLTQTAGKFQVRKA